MQNNVSHRTIKIISRAKCGKAEVQRLQVDLKHFRGDFGGSVVGGSEVGGCFCECTTDTLVIKFMMILTTDIRKTHLFKLRNHSIINKSVGGSIFSGVRTRSFNLEKSFNVVIKMFCFPQFISILEITQQLPSDRKSFLQRAQ